MNIQHFYPKHWLAQDEANQGQLTPREALRSEIDRMFDNFFTPFWGMPSVFKEGAGLCGWKPSLDLHETEKTYEVAVELPGVDEKDISIELNADNTLVIRGEKKEETSKEDQATGTHRTERCFGSFCRTLLLPNDSQADDITASFDNGVLKIAIPKGESKNTKKIPISNEKQAG